MDVCIYTCVHIWYACTGHFLLKTVVASTPLSPLFGCYTVTCFWKLYKEGNSLCLAIFCFVWGLFWRFILYICLDLRNILRSKSFLDILVLKFSEKKGIFSFFLTRLLHSNLWQFMALKMNFSPEKAIGKALQSRLSGIQVQIQVCAVFFLWWTDYPSCQLPNGVWVDIPGGSSGFNILWLCFCPLSSPLDSGPGLRRGGG